MRRDLWRRVQKIDAPSVHERGLFTGLFTDPAPGKINPFEGQFVFTETLAIRYDSRRRKARLSWIVSSLFS